MEKRHLDYLDLTKGIGIILVVVAHSTFTSDHVQAYISAFHMPLFFIVSGMLMYVTGEERMPLGSVLRKKARTILVPYVTFSIAYLIIDIIDMYLKIEPLTWVDIGNTALMFVTLHGISVLWFLTALFFGQLLFLGLKIRCGRRKSGDASVIWAGILAAVMMTAGGFLFRAYYPLEKSIPILCVGCLLMVALRSLGAFSFLTIGYYSYQFYFEKRDKMILENEKREHSLKWQEAVGGVLCLLLVAVISRLNGTVDLNNLLFANPVLYYLGAVTGTFGVMLLCRQLGRCRPLGYLGANSLIIMATHLDFQVMFYGHLFAYWVNNHITKGIFYLSVAFAVTLMEIVLIYFINRWLPFMLGKRKGI